MTRSGAGRPYQVVLVGYGEQARRFYHPVFDSLASRYPMRLRLVIDLADRIDAIRGWLAERRLRPDRLLLLDPRYRRSSTLAPEAAAALAALRARGAVDRLLVCTEPKAHKPYALWGARHAVDTLCEKPLTAVAGLAAGEEALARELAEDWAEIATAAENGGGRLVLMSPRRTHQGFRLIVDYLREFLARFRVPVTQVEGSHAEGVWNLPDEFLTRENHPYRYGYGKLLHSGYHYIDLTTRIAALNGRLPGAVADELVLVAQATRPADFFAQFDSDRYAHLLGTDRFHDLLREDAGRFSHLGETDVQVLGQFRRGGRVLTNLVLSLNQTSVNTRFWNRLPDDLRRNGRLPRERLTVHVGHLLTLEAVARYTTEAEEKVTGASNPFVVHVHRNVGVVGGEPFEELRPASGDARVLSEAARRDLVEAWLTGAPVVSEVADHELSVQVLSGIYASLARRRAGRDGAVSLRLEPGGAA